MIPAATPEAIAHAVRAFFADPDQVARYRTNATFAARELDGEVEKERLVAVLRNA